MRQTKVIFKYWFKFTIIGLFFWIGGIKVHAAPLNFMTEIIQCQKGDNVILQLKGNEIENIYGYEVEVSYPYDKLIFLNVKSKIAEGIEASLETDHSVNYVYTQVGVDAESLPTDMVWSEWVFNAKEVGEVVVNITSMKVMDINYQLINEPNSQIFCKIKIVDNENNEIPNSDGNINDSSSNTTVDIQKKNEEAKEKNSIENKKSNIKEERNVEKNSESNIDEDTIDKNTIDKNELDTTIDGKKLPEETIEDELIPQGESKLKEDFYKKKNIQVFKIIIVIMCFIGISVICLKIKRFYHF